MIASAISSKPETPSDEPFLRRLIAETVTGQLATASWPSALREQIVDMQFKARRQAVRLEFPEGESRILLLDGREAGWLYVAELPGEIRLVEIMVLAAFRRQGIGTAAICELIAAARGAGKPLRLSVDVMNADAIRLYQRAGFRRTNGDEVRHFMEHRER